MQPSQQIDALFDTARTYQKVGKSADAMALYERIIALAPAHTASCDNLCFLLYQQGKLDKAIARYQQLLAHKPDYAPAHNNIGNILKDLGRLEDAVIQYHQALAIAPGNAEIHYNLGNVLESQGKLDAAVQCYERALAYNPKYLPAYDNLGVVLSKKGEVGKAIMQYQKALAIKPDYAKAHYSLGTLLKNQGRLEEAAARYRQALAHDPSYIEAHYNLGQILKEQDKADEAIAHLRQCLALHPADRLGVRLLLAELGAEPMPDHAPEAHLQFMYAERASRWDKGIHDRSYRGHILIADAFHQFCPDAEKKDILDIGCGTGLVGELLHQRARRLDGVDLSPAMLQKAKAKGIYTAIHQGDFITFMAKKPASYDVITAAAVLIHFGDLAPILAAASTALRKDGLLLATLFPLDDGRKEFGIASSPELAAGGCYVHSESYIRRLAAETGFAVEALRTDIHEYYKSIPVNGLIVALRRK